MNSRERAATPPATPRPALACDADEAREGRRPRPEQVDRFVRGFIRCLMSWAKQGPTVSASAYVGVTERLLAIRFTLNRPPEDGSAVDVSRDNAEVEAMIARAEEVVPACGPRRGDLSVFDGRHILMFRRFGESLSKAAAVDAAREVASHILMSKEKRR